MSYLESPPETADVGPISTSTRWAWLMVFLPVPIAIMDAIVAATVGLTLEWQLTDFLIALVVLGMSLWLAWNDSEELVRRGLNTPAIWWCAIGYPVYLLVRAIKARGGDALRWWIFAASLGVFAVYVIGSSLLLLPADLSDPETVEGPLEDALKAQTGVDFDVTCPATLPQSTGATFACRAVPAVGPAVIVEVKLTNTDGEFRWRINPG